MVNFSSDDEKKVLEELTKIDPKLGKIYHSGLIVLRQKTTQTQVSESPFSETTLDKDSQTDPNPSCENFTENPDRIAQSAHSMRETLNITLRQSKIAAVSNLTFKSKVQKITDPQVGLPDFLLFPYTQLTKLHKWFVDVSHHGHSPSEQEYLTKVNEFTSLLRHILTPHYEIIPEIDELIEKSSVGKKDLEILELLMSKNTEAYRYFFTHATDNWLEVLANNNNYFKHIPPVVKNENSYSSPFWPESFYLERVASKKPELVQRIILKIQLPAKNPERNIAVLRNFTRAALKMPPKIGKAVAEKAIQEKWRELTPVLILESDLADLMVRLVDTEFGASLRLCDFLLDVTLIDSTIPNMFSSNSGKELCSVIDQYSYEKILKENVPVLSNKNHDAVIQILAKKLSKANYLDGKNYQESKRDPNQDISYVWRPAVEEHGQNFDLDLRSHLVAGICRTLEKSESAGIGSLKNSLGILAGHDYYIFRRLEMYFYGRHPSKFNEEINRLSIQCFGKNTFKHEYYHMLKSCYPYLKPETQNKILDIISKGPNFDNFNGSEDELETYKKHWRIEKLSPIIEHLPDLQEEYKTHVRQHGRSNLTEFVSWHESALQVTYPSDLTENMTVTEVIEFIKSYEMPRGIFLEEDGSGRKFEELVEKRPEEYSQHAAELLSCHGLFHFRFLSGLSKAKDKRLDWDAVLTFCESVITTSPSKDIRILDSTLDYFGELLERNLFHDENGISFSLRDRIWKILSRAMEISPPDTSWSENYPGKNWDAVGISINSSIGRLGYAIMQYAVWCYHGLKNQGLPHAELVPEVKSLLESILNPKQEQSISIHAVLGYHFHNLLAIDEEWAKSKINLIFKHDTASAKFGDAAWDAYASQRVYRKSFNALFDEYVYRITHSGKGTDSSLNNLQKRVTQHIGLVYLHSIGRSDDLFETFLKKSDPRLVADCLEWIGRTLKRWDGAAPPKMDVLKLVSYPQIKSNPSAGWLFLNPFMPRQERIKLLSSILDETEGEISPTYWVPEELEKFAEEYPLETVECVDKIVRHYQISGEMHVMLSHFGNAFQLIRKTKHEPAMKKMNDLIHFLGSLGYDDFKEFLS